MTNINEEDELNNSISFSYDNGDEKTENDEGEEEDRALRVNVVVGQEGEPVHRQELYLPLNLLSNGIPCQS